MKQILRSGVVALLMVQVYGLGVEAAVFERDWKAPGDGLLTYDNVNQREWLDLSVSRLDQFPEPRLQNAIAEIAPGGLFEGFSLARRNEVIRFAQSAGIDTTSLDAAKNKDATMNVVELLSVTLQSSDSVRSVGSVDETVAESLSAQLAIQFFIRPQVGQAGYSLAPLDVLQGHGLMLYRNIPEPGSFCLGAICTMVAALVFRWRS